jgi:peptide/nickel transport system substrate-binding protein/oligopeptide transport system substrate-binding protein
MMLRRLALLSLAALPLALGGCLGGDDRAVRVLVIGDPGSVFAGGPRLPLAAQVLRGASAEGLVGFDEEGRVAPALADRWIVTDDGLSYIFRLRDGTWPGGAPITAESAQAALGQALALQRGQPLGADLSVIEEVRAMAGRVIEIRLKRQMPDLLQLLAQPELGLTRGNRGAGPMRSRRDSDKELGLSGVLLRAIAPEDRGMPPEEGWDERVQPVHLSALPAAKAIELFNSGEAEVVLGGSFVDYPRLGAASVSGGAIRFDQVAGLFGLAVVRGEGFLAEPENREAIAMAIDREALIAAVNLNGWIATTRVVNPGLEGDSGAIVERWVGRGIDERQVIAAARVAKWRAGKQGAIRLRIALPAGPGADVLFRRLSEDLKAIGISAQKVPMAANADLRLIDTVARYARPAWFFNQLSCAQARALCSASADALFARSEAEADPVKRADLLSDAEAQLTQANGYIPFGVPIRWSLVAGGTTGFAVNRLGVHPLMPLARLPK